MDDRVEEFIDEAERRDHFGNAVEVGWDYISHARRWVVGEPVQFVDNKGFGQICAEQRCELIE